MMDDPSLSTSRLFYNAALYRICVSGLLTADWSERLQGMRIMPVEDQDGSISTELSGVLADQAALMGVLTHLYDCGVALISVAIESIKSPEC